MNAERNSKCATNWPAPVLPEGMRRRLSGSVDHRSGKVLILLALSLPMLLAMLGLVVDGGLLLAERRSLQTTADAAALRAALRLSQGESAAQAAAAAEDLVHNLNSHPGAVVEVHVPPASGPYAGLSDHVEVVVADSYSACFMKVGSSSNHSVRVTSTAAIEDATSGGVLVALDPDPTPMTISGLPIGAIALPLVHLGACEVLGLGQLNVQGAVFVNCRWGGVDETGAPAGDQSSFPSALACTPLLPLTKLAAADIRVTGGVDDPLNYRHVDSGQPSPLRANRLPVPDPLSSLPVPTVAVDPDNVDPTLRGSRNVISIPLIPLVTLQPGVYEWIQVTSGAVRFQPGVYVIRSRHPVTQIALNIVAGQVTAEGVMFYITDNASYSALNGWPDSGDGETVPPTSGLGAAIPSVVINMAVLGSSWSGLNDPGSPFDGMLLYQRRTSRLPLVIIAEQLIGNAAFSGTVYAKWGQVVFTGHGTYDLRMAAGTLRLVNTLTCTLDPSQRFPPARDVFLVK